MPQKIKRKKELTKKIIFHCSEFAVKNGLLVDSRQMYNISYIMKLSKEILPHFFLIFTVKNSVAKSLSDDTHLVCNAWSISGAES